MNKPVDVAQVNRFRTMVARMESWIGKEVVMEGPFPMPVQTPQGMQMAMTPAKGTLVEVYGDANGTVTGFTVLESGDSEPTVYNMVNLRTVTPMQDSPERGLKKIIGLGQN